MNAAAFGAALVCYSSGASWGLESKEVKGGLRVYEALEVGHGAIPAGVSVCGVGIVSLPGGHVVGVIVFTLTNSG